jgi:hypothetical protein
MLLHAFVIHHILPTWWPIHGGSSSEWITIPLHDFDIRHTLSIWWTIHGGNSNERRHYQHDLEHTTRKYIRTQNNPSWYECKPSCSSQSTCNSTHSDTMSCSHQLTHSHCPFAKSTATTKSLMCLPSSTHRLITDYAKSLLFRKVAWWTIIHTIRLTTSERNSIASIWEALTCIVH